jgi:hypothetical protein
MRMDELIEVAQDKAKWQDFVNTLTNFVAS